MHALQKLLLCHVLTCLGQNAHGVIDGIKAPEGSMLYMASVQSNNHHICGGFLISKDFVLTAAHCDDVNPTTVVLGTHSLKRPYAKRTIVKKSKHPDYVSLAKGSDLMLLKLSNEVPPDNRIQLIQLSHRTIHENSKCSVAGWGKTTSDGEVVDELKVVDVSVISQRVCEEKWSRHPADIFCAGGYNTTKGFCQGDSGAPLVCNGKAVGVASFNYLSNCHYPDVHPNVYTDISKFLPWILNILEGERCSMI